MTNLLFKLRTVVSCLSKNSTVRLFFDIEIPKFDKKNTQFCLFFVMTNLYQMTILDTTVSTFELFRLILKRQAERVS